MEKQIEEKNTEMGSVITRSEEFIQKNQKTIIICIVAILVVVLAIFGLRKWYFQPREVRAAEEMFAAEQWFAQGDYEKALNGDDTFRGFMSVIDSYGCTKAGNLAKYYAGIANLRLGNYDEAAKWLGKYSGKDTFTKPIAIMAQGDAEMELGNTDKAAKPVCVTSRNRHVADCTIRDFHLLAGACIILIQSTREATNVIKPRNGSCCRNRAILD